MTAPVQHAHAVDAAARPQDPSYFAGQNRLEPDPDQSVAAQLMGNPLGGLRPYKTKKHCHVSAPVFAA